MSSSVSSSESSTVAIRITFTALPVSSAGRSCPLGPLVHFYSLGIISPTKTLGSLLQGSSSNGGACPFDL